MDWLPTYVFNGILFVASIALLIYLDRRGE